MRTADKKRRYHPVLGDDVNNFFMRFVAFVVMLLHIHLYFTEVEDAIARYNNVMAAAQAWVHRWLHLSATLTIGGG